MEFLADKISMKEQTIEEMARTVKSLSQERDELNKTLKGHLKTIDGMSENKVALQKENEKLHERVIQCTGKIHAIAQEILLAKKELVLRSQQNKEIETSNSKREAELNQKLANATYNMENMKAELESTKEALNYITKQPGVYSPRSKRNNRDLTLAKDQNSKLVEKNRELHAVVESSKMKIRVMKNKLALTNEILGTQREQLNLNAENNVRLKERCNHFQKLLMQREK